MSEVEVARARRIEEAATFLRSLNFDPERSNERSALVLLALARIRPATPWREASAPMTGVTPIMEWLAEHYGKVYKPNTRETVRRRTLHQFVSAGLVAENPDEPGRPPNSPKWCYQLQEEALAVVRTIGEPGHEELVSTYLDELPGMLASYEAARALERVPVTLPNVESVTPSPGGQNVLIRDMVQLVFPHSGTSAPVSSRDRVGNRGVVRGASGPPDPFRRRAVPRALRRLRLGEDRLAAATRWEGAWTA